MSEAPRKPARVVAVEALRRFDSNDTYISSILEALLDQTDQRQRVTDLVYGTVRNLAALDAIIAKFSGRPINRIAKPLLAVLRVGAYELIYSPATPPYSVVDEAAKMASRFGGKKQTGFVNAILRQVLRHIVAREVPLSGSSPSRTLVQTSETGCQFDMDVLPDPNSSPVMHLSACFSLPQWLVADWITEFGYDRAREICMGSNRRPSVYIRVNPLRATGCDLLAQFETAGVRAEAVADTCPEMIRLIGPQSIAALPGFCRRALHGPGSLRGRGGDSPRSPTGVENPRSLCRAGHQDNATGRGHRRQCRDLCYGYRC